MKIATAFSKDRKRKIEIAFEESPIDPRSVVEGCAFGVLCIWSSSLISKNEEDTFWPKKRDHQSIENFISDNFTGTDAVLPLYLGKNEFGKRTVSTTPDAKLDSKDKELAVIGVIYALSDSIKETYGDNRKQSVEMARQMLEAEVKELSDYLQGKVYKYVQYVKDENDGWVYDEYGEDEELPPGVESFAAKASNWGIIGDWKKVLTSEVQEFKDMDITIH